MTKKENIIQLLEQVDKPEFAKILAEHFGKSESSIYTNWISKGWIPEGLQNDVLTILQNKIKLQNESKTN